LSSPSPLDWRSPWFPAAIDPAVGIGEGARIEMRGTEVWLHEQHEIAYCQYGSISSRRVNSISDAVRLYIAANGGAPMDGVNIDWGG
jgi:hypothetical protein